MKLMIIGTSTTALHAYEFIKNYKLFDVIGFAVDSKYRDKDVFQGMPVYDLENLDQVMDMKHDLVFVAMLWNSLNRNRRDVFERLDAQGVHFANLISPYARVRGHITGRNVWLHDYVIVQNDAVIGDDVMVMAYSLIGAHARIGNHCFLGAKSTVAGGSSIGEQSFIGINCTVFDDTQVGNRVVCGACTAIKRNVPDNTVCKTAGENIVVKTYPAEIIESKLMFSKNIRSVYSHNIQNSGGGTTAFVICQAGMIVIPLRGGMQHEAA